MTRITLRTLGSLAALGLIAVVGLWWFWPPSKQSLGGNRSELYRLGIAAMVASEEANYSAATELWEQLAASPETPVEAIQLNQAVTLIKWVEQIEEALASGGGTAAELAAKREQLQLVQSKVDRVLDALATLPQQSDKTAYLAACLILKQAKVDAAAADLMRRKLAIERLQNGLKANPGSALLACKFDELSNELPGVDGEELRAANAQYLWESYQRSPRNLFLLKRTAEVLLSMQDPRLSELLQPSLQITASMVDSPNVARIVKQVDPPKLIETVAQAIANGDWGQARQLQRWLNTMVGMPAFSSDSRIVKPDVLALLDIAFVQETATLDATDVAPSLASIPRMTVTELPRAAQAIGWYDFDFDLDFDVLLLAGTALEFYELTDSSIAIEPKFIVELGAAMTHFVPVDLFEVDLPERPQWPASVADLMSATPTQPNQGDASVLAAAPQAAPAKRHDTVQELLLWGPSGIQIVTFNAAANAYRLIAQPPGLEMFRDVVQVLPVDFESDGDLDLAISTQSGFHLLQNNGNRTFADISRFSQLPTACAHMVSGDFDFDTDQDILIVDPAQEQSQIIENLRHSEFSIRAMSGPEWQVGNSAQAAAVGDIDSNGSWDFATVLSDKVHVTRTRLLDDGTLSPLVFQTLPTGGSALAIEDFNNDGALDVLVGTPSGVVCHLGHPSGNLSAASAEVALRGLAIANFSMLDANGDGTLDFVAVSQDKLGDGTLGDRKSFVSIADPPVQANYLLARVRGINDVNGGGRVNHYCVGSTLQVWAGQQLQSRIVRQPVTHFGLGDATVENIRIIFNNGLTQNVEDLATNALIEEKQTLRGSCPFIYGWNGERFELITDLLWNAPLGLQIAKGVVLPDRRWENLILPGSKVRSRDGQVELRLTEELWEVAYFDQVRLAAVDHPPDVRIFSNEKVGPPDMAQHQLFAVRERVELRTAVDGRGRDISTRLRELDQVYVQAFDRQVCQGLAEPHFIELDFGKLPLHRDCRLFLTGWMFPTDTSLNIGIDQNSQLAPPEAPSLWVRGNTGQWVCRQPFMGFPGGKPKSMVVDLKDVFVSDDHRLRIGSSQQIYWDEAFVGWHAGDDAFRQQDMSMHSAELRYRGFSQQLPREADQPHWYDYQTVTTSASWPPLAGPFTRYGNVLQELQSNDDRMVILTAGDEISFSFSDPSQGVPPNWQRDYVLHNEGWDKDADLNTLMGTSSLPLPFAAQHAYPPGEEQRAEALDTWNKNADSLTRTPRDAPASWARGGMPKTARPAR